MKYPSVKVFLISLLFALVVWFLFTGFSLPVTWEYGEIAKNIIERHTFSYSHLGAEYLCFCQPLYPFLVAVVYFISNYNHSAVVFIQIILYSLLCAAVFKIGRNIFNIKTGLIASIFIMVHPGIVFYVLRNEHSLILDTFMFILSTFCILALYDKQDSIKKAIICGIVLGLSALSRGTALILVLLFMVWIIFTFSMPIKRRLFLAFLIALVSVITILPWTIRNYIVTRKIILIGAVSEECLWRGNNPNASGSSYDEKGNIVLYENSNRDLLKRIYASDEIGQKRIFEKEALRFIKNNPGKFIGLFLRKLYYFWWFAPQTGVTYPVLFKRIYQVYYIFILIGVFLGIYFMRKQSKAFYDKVFLLIGVLISISFLQSIFYVEMRHRWGVEPLMLIFAANGIVNIKNIFERNLP